MILIIGTHLLMSNILYKYILKQLNFKLNRTAFMYGNIKPDINPEDINCKHVLEESIYSVAKYSRKLMNHNVSIKEYSVSLGVICHFICDYFCIYHTERNKGKGIFQHILYEINLEFKFWTLIIGRKIKLNNNKLSGKNIINMLLEVQKKYNLEEESSKKDITYAISTSALILKSIVFSSEIYHSENNINSSVSAI